MVRVRNPAGMQVVRRAIAEDTMANLEARMKKVLANAAAVVHLVLSGRLSLSQREDFDTNLVELTLIRERLYEEPLQYVEAPNLGIATHHSIEEAAAALKASGSTSAKRQAVGCQMCGKVGADHKVCGKCKSVVYCSKECQKLDWKKHKTVCILH